MCKVYNSIGSLRVIKTHLHENNINEFKSLNELINFQNNFSIAYKQIISDHNVLIEQEKNILKKEISLLNDSIAKTKNEIEDQINLEIGTLKEKMESLPSIHSNLKNEFITDLKKINLWIRIKIKEAKFSKMIDNSVELSSASLVVKNNRYQYLVSNFLDAVNESSSNEIYQLQRKKRVIDEIDKSIYGAIGEQKVVKEIEKLSDDFFLINDFTYSFDKSIYSQQDESYIKSIQIDHILICCSGIFIIETKNWSKNTLNDMNLFSPVQQVKRAGFALYILLNGEISKSTLSLKKHHWGDRKIPIKNLIVLINQKPIEEFQYVKIITLKELLGYVKFFKPCLSKYETEIVADYLLNINNRTNYL